MVSGSAALPEPLALRWTAISGHVLLERYGMTEFAMAISNPLAGERRLNSIGRPLPGYEARIAALDGEAEGGGGAQAQVPAASASAAAAGGFAGPGELQMRGPGVFREYWGKPEATAESFTADGWFRTGDCAERDVDGYFRILGRLSADIIKSGGFKLSALDIERVLLEHPDVAECAVLGVADAVYGEKVAAVAVLRAGSALLALEAGGAREAALLAGVRAWGRDRIAAYKLPSIVRVLDEMPRNAMGKVNKKELRKALFG
jgi:malonyl-CoA/methylmalonyl-CoA synthetase